MKTKKLSIRNINSIRKYLTIFSGIFRLTDAEIDVLSAMIRYRLKGLLTESHADPFTSDAKKKIAEELGMANPYSMNTYMQRFREKGVIIKEDNVQMFHPWLMPMGEQEIIIKPEWKLSLD